MSNHVNERNDFNAETQRAQRTPRNFMSQKSDATTGWPSPTGWVPKAQEASGQASVPVGVSASEKERPSWSFLSLRDTARWAVPPGVVTALLVLMVSFSAFGGDSKWIWSQSGESDNAPRYVRAVFDLADDAAKANLVITCDNGYTAFVNGKQVGSGNAWENPGNYDVAVHLVKGKNVVAVDARNNGGIAGLLAELAITLKNGTKTKIVSDKSWTFSLKADKDWNTAGFAGGDYKPCLEVGEWNSGPWNLTVWGSAAAPAVTAGNQAAPLPAGPADDPEVERQSFQVLDGFEVNLFAADPLLAKPIHMNFDNAGRLWVVSSSIYPQIRPGEVANDKVLILDDKDNDGKAESAQVFADGLLIPTGIEIGDGGAYVANSTEIIHLKDTNGDGKADSRRTVLSGFGTEDTHHIVHSFRWGPDGYLYFNQSIYIHSHIETPHGTKRLGGGGIWRFRPSTYELEVLCKGMCNPWGHQIDRFGQSFGTDGAGGDGIHYLIPGATYPHFPGGGKVMPGLNPGSPKYCGMEIMSGRHLPEDWTGSIIANDFRAHRVVRYQITEDGSGYSSKLMPDVIKTKSQAFRPIDVKMGPDGAVYIADWYNPIINHGEVDFFDKRRDRTRGRIWRITAKGRPLVEKPKLVGAPVKDLLEQLRAPEDYTRQRAKRVLAERDPKEVLPVLGEWVKSLSPEAKDDQLRLEALWCYQTLDIVEAELLKRVLRCETPQVRAGATRVAILWRGRLPNALDLLAAQAADDHPRVRLEAVRGLKEFGTGKAIEAAVRAVDKPVDRFIKYALELTIDETKSNWLSALENGELLFGGNAKQMEFVLKAVKSPKAIKSIAEQLKAGKTPPENYDSVLDLIAEVGGQEELDTVAAIAGNDASNALLRARSLPALARATTQRKMKVSLSDAVLTKLIDSTDAAISLEAVRLGGAMKSEALRPKFVELSGSETAGAERRAAAIEAIASLGGPPSLEFLQQLSTAGKPAPSRILAAAALAKLDVKVAAARAAEVLASDLGSASPVPLFNAFLQRSNAAEALAAELKKLDKIPTDTAKLGIRTAQAAAQVDSLLIQALAKAGGISADPPDISKEEMAKIIAEVGTKGDPARGEALFRRADLACQKCHSIGGAGGNVGPDLVSIGASAPLDYLVESLYFPNKAVKEGYHSLIVTTKDGRVLTGIKVRQENNSIVLRDANADETIVQQSNIAKQRNAGSIMPAGLMDPLTRAEVLDMVRFLSELGRPGPYAASGAPIARRWMMLDPQSGTLAFKLTPKEVGDELRLGAGVKWLPVYSQVSGNLPHAELAAFKKQGGDVSIVRAQLDVSTGGMLRFKVNTVNGLNVWIDGVLLDVKADQFEVELAPGVRNLDFRIVHNPAVKELRLELLEVPGSKAKAQFVTGK